MTDQHRTLQDITTVIFDADYTLYTPAAEAGYDAKFEYLSKETGKKRDALQRAWEQIVTRAEQSEQPGEWERKQLLKQTLEHVGAQTDDETIEEAYTLFWETVVDNTTAPDGVGRILRRLKDAGYHVAIATDEFPEPLRLKLETVIRDTDVDAFFDMIVTPRDTGKRKPAEAFYTPILDACNARPEQAVMVGDSWVRDLQPAQDLGMMTVLVGTSDPEGTPDYHFQDVTGLEHLFWPDDA